jgi:aspartate aminotransferase-like enzyme
MSTGIDLERVRADTPGCAKVAHLNNAGSALPPDQVVDSVVSFLRREAEIGGYEAKAEAQAELESSYDSVARLINADRSEIAMVENATRAWDMAFYGLKFRPGDRILTAQAEYASNAIAFLQVARQHGVSVEVLPDGDDGCLSTDALRSMLDERVRLIAVTHTPTHNGLLNPAAEIGAIARSAGVLYLLDACQSVGQVPIDVREIGCHFLSATGRKFLGYELWCGAGDRIKCAVARKALETYKQRIRQLTRRSGGRSLPEVVERLRTYMPGWKAYFQLAQTPKVFRELDKWLRHRLRALQLKHWRRGKTIHRELMALGASTIDAERVAGNSRCWWRNSYMLLNRAMPIAYFDRLGVPRLS